MMSPRSPRHAGRGEGASSTYNRDSMIEGCARRLAHPQTCASGFVARNLLGFFFDKEGRAFGFFGNTTKNDHRSLLQLMSQHRDEMFLPDKRQARSEYSVNIF